LQSVAETLIRRRLLVAEAQKMRIEVSPADVAADVRTLAAAGGEPSVFWERLKQLGLGEAELGRRCRDLLLTTRYLSLRQEMTYVPEAEVRAYYGEHGGDFKGTPLFQVREEVRALLSKKKYEQELDQWFSRQIDDGRVRVFGLPSDPAEDAPR
ncbi:MAG: hypothetical protein HGA98_04540, partial [Deltaproteobacteria bacterium]|nr:hypothetical protein [Deltaproteobacteria bacterium]